MLYIGLTGGIGSGKSTVAGIFEVFGVPVYYADMEAKKLMNENKPMIKALQDTFGEEVYDNGILDRKFLADLVFKDEEKLALLNSIVHPELIKAAEKWIKGQTSPYIIKEAALLFETGSNEYLDFIVGVYSPMELRIQRIILRDNINRSQVMERIDKQMEEEKKMALCDFIITNDEQQMLLPQVLELHHKFLQLSEQINASSG